MFGITYESWKKTCYRYLYKLKRGQQSSYLQFYPFYKLSDIEKQYIISEKFFNKYIKNFSCVFLDCCIEKTDNFLQKDDGNLRNAVLISPILFLIIESIGQEMNNVYQKGRANNIEVFYAGDFNSHDATYKKSYDQFTKMINIEIDNYDYFIKTDIQNFFDNIDVNILLKNISDNNNYFRSVQLKMIKELLLYCGDNKFPIIENSMSLSYLATIIYLNDIDNQINCFIQNNINEISDVKIFRYVDDMYIMFNSTKEYDDLIPVYQNILYEYSSILKTKKLFLNSKKCKLDFVTEINYELKKSLYNEIFNDKHFDIDDLVLAPNIENFLEEISSKYSITHEEYKSLIDKYFNLEGSELSASEILNTLIYKYQEIFINRGIIENLTNIIQNNFTVIYLDPKKFISIILNTRDEDLIKHLLNTIFIKSRNDNWNIFDTMISALYLLKRNFKHEDLKELLKEKDLGLYNFCINYCNQSLLKELLANDEIDKLIELINLDNNISFLYSMYIFERHRFNMLSAFAFYKNYYDRLLAHLEYKYNPDPKAKRPNFKKFYNKTEWEKVFKNNNKSNEKIIQEIYNMRNANPICHSSSELIANNDMDEDILLVIQKMDTLFEQYKDMIEK